MTEEQQTNWVERPAYEVIANTRKRLPVPVEGDDYIATAEEAGQVRRDLATVEAEKKAAVSACKARTEQLEGRASELATILLDHERFEEIGCEQRLYPQEALVRTVRLDTGAVVDVRPATQIEIQRSFAFAPSEVDGSDDDTKQE